MSIKEILLPVTELGNDPNDHRRARGYLGLPAKPLDPIEVTLLQNPTEDSVALMFARKYKGELMYCHQHAAWFTWSGKHWQREETSLAKEYVRQLSRALNTHGKASMARSSFVNGAEQLARGDRAFAVHSNKLDLDRWQLNTPAGTFNLLTRENHKHNPEDRITKITTVGPCSAGGEVFKQFMDDITLEDKELQSFLQRALGSMLSGAVEEHWLMFWIGEGRNGKNTLGDAIKDILGDYARQVPASTLLSTRNESHPTDLANLQGIRLAISSEIPEGSFFNEARIKNLTGDATIPARFMRGDFFEFTRTHKHLIYGNSRPQLRAVDLAIKSRLKIVPFRANFTSKEDPDMPAKLEKESSYILQWLMDGHQSWLDAGKQIGSCAAVDAELDDYFASQSTPELWLEECCSVTLDSDEPGRYWAKAKDLYESYRQWKLNRGEHAVSQTRWSDFMSAKFQKMKADGVRYRGVVLGV